MGTIAGVKAERKGHGNNRVLVTEKQKQLYKDPHYRETQMTHAQAERLYQKFVRDHSQVESYASSWAGVKT